MKPRIGLAMTAALIVVLSSGLFAQRIAPVPLTDAGIVGTGTIKTPDGALGSFSINVVRRGNVISGFFRYAEIRATAVSAAGNSILTKQITGLRVLGNTAVVDAVGLFNGRPANLTFEGLDDNPSGDWIRITAAPIGMLPYIWSVAGGLASGDVLIWERPAEPPRAKGCGWIAIRNTDASMRQGYFNFYAAPSWSNTVPPEGFLNYAEPYAGPVDCIRPRVKIDVPLFEAVLIIRNTVTMRGKGVINGEPCLVEAVGVDNAPVGDGLTRPDSFEIRAFKAWGTPPIYQAIGPVIKGDIVVFPGG